MAAADIKKLKEGGINTVESLAHSTKKELCAIKGISEAKVAKMQAEGARPAASAPRERVLPLPPGRQGCSRDTAPLLRRSVEGGAHGLHDGDGRRRAARGHRADHDWLQGV